MTVRGRSISQSSPEHWSKDFVEHLRTVHFTVLSISIGLILRLSSKPYKPEIGAYQMSDISNVLGLWSGDRM
jgi:hypothetical protein